MDGKLDRFVGSTPRRTVNTDPADAGSPDQCARRRQVDQTTLPSAIELQVGRVDLANHAVQTTWKWAGHVPQRTELLRQYSRKTTIPPSDRERPAPRIVGDSSRSASGEAFAASGYRNFAPLVGSDKITNLTRSYNDQRGVEIPALAAGDYSVSPMAVAPGSYTAVSRSRQLGQYNDCDTVELVSNDVHATFRLLFGSGLATGPCGQHARAPLATKTTALSPVWSGRPMVHASARPW